jgi:hypothetical protein
MLSITDDATRTQKKMTSQESQNDGDAPPPIQMQKNAKRGVMWSGSEEIPSSIPPPMAVRITTV